MNKHHRLQMSPKKYPNGLRFVECSECNYAFAVTVNEYGIIQMDTRVQVNEGDPEASHSFFQAPAAPPTIDMSAGISPSAMAD